MSVPLKKHSKTEAPKIIRRILKNGAVVPSVGSPERKDEGKGIVDDSQVNNGK